MENINAEIFTLRNQRKQIKDLTDKLKAVLGQFDQLENELLKAQYKHGLMIAFDEIGYEKENYFKRINELFEIKQNYHHLWSETQQLCKSMEKHYSSEEGLLQDLMRKINSLTPDHIEGIKGIQHKKKELKDHYFKDITNIKKEIDDMKKIILELEGMRSYVKGESPKAYYNKETKDFNAIMDKINSENEKLDQFKKISNSNMIKSTEALLRTLEQDKDNIIRKTVSAIDETLEALNQKIVSRENVAEKYYKIKAVRVLVQGLPWSGKFSLIHLIDPYSALQRKGSFMVVNSPDYIFSAFKGLLVWVKDEEENSKKGKLITLPDFEENFELYKERIKVKIEITCGTGHSDEEIYGKILDGMKFQGLIYVYDSSDVSSIDKAKNLLESTEDILKLPHPNHELILANKADLKVNTASNILKNAKQVSIKANNSEVMDIITNYANELVSSLDDFKKLVILDVD